MLTPSEKAQVEKTVNNNGNLETQNFTWQKRQEAEAEIRRQQDQRKS